MTQIGTLYIRLKLYSYQCYYYCFPLNSMFYELCFDWFGCWFRTQVFRNWRPFIVNRRHSIVNKADSWRRIKMGLSKFLVIYLSLAMILRIFLIFWQILSLVILIKRILIKKKSDVKVKHKRIVLYLRNVSLMYIFMYMFILGTKIFRWSAENCFIKRLFVYMIIFFISQHVDWVLFIISKCHWMNYL